MNVLSVKTKCSPSYQESQCINVIQIVPFSKMKSNNRTIVGISFPKLLLEELDLDKNQTCYDDLFSSGKVHQLPFFDVLPSSLNSDYFNLLLFLFFNCLLVFFML